MIVLRALKPVYTAAIEEAAFGRFAEFADAWGKKYPAIVRFWENLPSVVTHWTPLATRHE
ncbi:transposase [Streptomyces sp. NBC_00667]|nr:MULTISPECIES: transposase [unclassified Streptomyces]WUC68924.1 transposase [Streptomyces sp. NBC_00539]